MSHRSKTPPTGSVAIPPQLAVHVFWILERVRFQVVAGSPAGRGGIHCSRGASYGITDCAHSATRGFGRDQEELEVCLLKPSGSFPTQIDSSAFHPPWAVY
jgi:hypothetical protein